ncbi:MAG TPA: hypothetical protein PKB10_12715, partial [Tepidisphaeraceae bacterium]|nr:hypothetical protein [Tepidisphaeraceae bacterium]
SFSVGRIGQFLDQFIADPDPSARLDFLAYHQYLTPRQAEPDLVNDEGAQLRRMLAERGLDPALPVHVNENGGFPTNQGTTDIAGDLLTQATGCLALYRRYADQPGVRAYHWTWFHPNPRKNAFVPTPQRLARQRDSANRPDDPVRQVLQAHTHPTPDAFTPFGHALSLLARLSGERVRVEASPRNEAGLGIDAIASRDERTVTILVWDYSFTQREAPECRALTVEIDVDRPVSSARIERVDSGSGHYLGPHAAPLVDAAAVREIAPGRFSVCTTIPRNAICWIALDLG